MAPIRAPVKQRRYHSPRRQAQAQRTRAAILEAAEQLFFRRGYAATTVAAIAEAADVSVETIYKGFGGKAGLVRALYERGLAGAGPVPAYERSDRMQAEADDARSVIGHWGRLLTEVTQRAAPIVQLIRSAAASDPEAAALVDEIDRGRLLRMEQNARRLLALPGVRPGLTVAEARDVLWTYSAPELHDLLVGRRGWSLQEYGQFAVRGMSASLLAEPAG